ncbi:MAG: 3-hydroxyacyl-CoA dehydrogenase [Chitinophagaceae bacterium]|jgi:3-hydroxybutyryl-CoA dehydrogenase|nr:MAG: 3-hydroxyacyl-CoA dehydrogenase [Chitinophagaceae bacterium]
MHNDLIPILLIGNNRLAYSIAVCLLAGGHPVTLLTGSEEEAKRGINTHLHEMEVSGYKAPQGYTLQITKEINNPVNDPLVILITEEEIRAKVKYIQLVERYISPDSIIAVNTESISLNSLQRKSHYPNRVIGANWMEPAHTTLFLEIIANGNVDPKYIQSLLYFAKTSWQKDPYMVSGDCSVYAKLFASMAREAFYLVQNGFATIEDIDRACRNDAGYYAPFAGNCRYMDLMGTYAYGKVMKGLNPTLSKATGTPPFFNKIIEEGGNGIENGRGFYQYSVKSVRKWISTFRGFSYQIKRIMDKYPFNDLKNSIPSEGITRTNGQE